MSYGYNCACGQYHSPYTCPMSNMSVKPNNPYDMYAYYDNPFTNSVQLNPFQYQYQYNPYMPSMLNPYMFNQVYHKVNPNFPGPDNYVVTPVENHKQSKLEPPKQSKQPKLDEPIQPKNDIPKPSGITLDSLMDSEQLIVKPVIKKNHLSKSKKEPEPIQELNLEPIHKPKPFEYDDIQFIDEFVNNIDDKHIFKVEYGEHEEEPLTFDEHDQIDEYHLNEPLNDDSDSESDKEEQKYKDSAEQIDEYHLNAPLNDGSDSDEQADNHIEKYLENVEEELEEIVFTQPTKHKKTHSKLNENIDKLSIKLDNVLDKHINKRNKKSHQNDQDDQDEPTNNDAYYYLQYSNHSNVIKSCKPLHDNPAYAHFDKKLYPNEYYEVQYVSGINEYLPAGNINQPCLETAKHVYYHNKYIKTPKQTQGFIYARCSRENDVSIETQRSLCFQYARQNNIKLLPFGYVYDNNISARNMDNLNYELGFWSKYLQPNSHIIIYSVDRLSRNLIKGLLYLDDMLKKNISIHFVNDQLIYCNNMTAATKSMVQHQLQIAENFSNVTSEKIKATIKRKKAEGHVYGPAPYGFEVQIINGIRKHIPKTDELNNVHRISQQYNYIFDNFYRMTETRSIPKTETNIYKTLKRWCNRNGLFNRKNELFTTPEIKRILDINNKYSDIISSVITKSTPKRKHAKTYNKFEDM